MLKSLVVKSIGALGYQIQKKRSPLSDIAVELSSDEVALIQHVHESGYTMTSIPRLVATLKACKYVIDNNIDGDFVECGVWRGGNSILAKKYFEMVGSDRQVYMFDTFGGMTEPTEEDKVAATNESAQYKFESSQQDDHNEWCYASLEDVKRNCEASNLDMRGVNFVKGDVCLTLDESSNIPSKIAVLRLDTDWYESTLKELEVLYPRLSIHGSLLIDDYGHWAGARKAVDEFFEKNESKPLLQVTDYTGRSAIKM